MDKRVILAVAGAGKTYSLCKNVDVNKRNIILAFTNQNIKNISKELNENHDETIENTYVYTFDSFKYNFFIRPYEPIIAKHFGQNIKNISKELNENHDETIENTYVYTFDSFKYNFFIRPYEPIIAKHFGMTTFESKGVSLVTPPTRFKNNFPNPDYKDSSLFEHYVIKDKYYCDNLSELILKVNKKGEYNLFDIAMKNINNFFEYIYIDEFQDFRQHDYELMEKVIKKSKNIVLVGDYFQHSVNARNNTGKPFKVGNSKETKRIITYEEYIELLKKLNLKIDTESLKRTRRCRNNTGKPFKVGNSKETKRIITYEEYIELLKKLNLKIDTESLKRTRRCPENICKFIREKFNIQIYADNENKGDITFLEDINEIKKVIENNDIIKLVESDSKIYSFNCINWGYSKGDTYNDICVILTDRFKNLKKEKNIEYTSIVNKIYVALTRTKGNLYIIEKEKFDDIKYNYIKN